jgi:hypothetical protein
MAKAADVIRALAAGFVTQTRLFSRIVSITSLSASGGIATAACATEHGYSTGDYVYISGAQAPVQVSSITRTGDIATAITTQPHDLTKNADELFYNPTVKVSGADQAAYNGDAITLLTVPNRNEFTYAVSGSPATPATGTILAFDDKERGYNGLKQITVVDANTFTYEITGTPQPAIGTIVSHSNIRVSGAVDDERAIESYTKKLANEYWAFVILDNTDPSKDRSILNDSTGAPIVGNDFRQMMMQNFHILVFAPTKNEIAAREARDTMEDVYSFLVKSLCRTIFETSFSDSTTFQLISLGHDKFDYYKGFYVHKFNFQISNFIIFSDTIPPDLNVAFRDITLIINNSPDELVTAEIDLDEEPN